MSKVPLIVRVLRLWSEAQERGWTPEKLTEYNALLVQVEIETQRIERERRTVEGLKGDDSGTRK